MLLLILAIPTVICVLLCLQTILLTHWEMHATAEFGYWGAWYYRGVWRIAAEESMMSAKNTVSPLLRGSGSTNFGAMWPRMQPVVLKLLKQEQVSRDQWQDLFW